MFGTNPRTVMTTSEIYVLAQPSDDTRDFKPLQTFDHRSDFLLQQTDTCDFLNPIESGCRSPLWIRGSLIIENDVNFTTA